MSPPKFPSNLRWRPNVQVDLADRVQSEEAQVLSRTRLLDLIKKLNLYPSYANSPDDQVEKMRDDVKFELVQAPAASGNQELVAFKMTYKAPDAAMAQKVNGPLTSFFVDENVRASQEQSEATTHFLDTQVRALGQTLGRRRGQGARHIEPSPMDHCPSNYKAISKSSTAIQAQLQAAHSPHERALQKQTYIGLAAETIRNHGRFGECPTSLENQLEGARAQLADLQARYTDDHPTSRN